MYLYMKYRIHLYINTLVPPLLAVRSTAALYIHEHSTHSPLIWISDFPQMDYTYHI